MKLKNLIKNMAVTISAAAVIAGLGMGTTTTVQAANGLSVYTNEPVSQEQASKRPIAIMMPTDKSAQPSYGISQAKVLYEIMEEGNISRQMAIIDNWQGLSKIGNIRSARAYYIPVATEWDPLFIHFGGVFYMQARITQPDINNLSGTSEYGTGGTAPGSGAFFRTADRKAPHNAYTSGDNIARAASQLGYSLTVRPEYYNGKHFTFASGVNDLSQYGSSAYSATSIDLSGVFPYTRSSFTYDSGTGLYKKNLHGAPQVDGANGQQLAFANVIVQNTKWGTLDTKGYLSFENLDTTEDGYYFTKGRCIHVRWSKTAEYAPTVYYDDNGNEIQLNTGKTYIAIAQKGTSVSFS